MKKINWIAFWLLGTVTMGIYPIVVWCMLDSNAKKMADKTGAEKNGLSYILFGFLLGMVTCGITTVIWIYLHFKSQAAVANKLGVRLTPANNPWLLLLFSFIPVYSFYVICDNNNKLVDAMA